MTILITESFILKTLKEIDVKEPNHEQYFRGIGLLRLVHKTLAIDCLLPGIIRAANHTTDSRVIAGIASVQYSRDGNTIDINKVMGELEDAVRDVTYRYQQSKGSEKSRLDSLRTAQLNTEWSVAIATQGLIEFAITGDFQYAAAAADNATLAMAEAAWSKELATMPEDEAPVMRRAPTESAALTAARRLQISEFVAFLGANPKSFRH